MHVCVYLRMHEYCTQVRTHLGECSRSESEACASRRHTARARGLEPGCVEDDLAEIGALCARICMCFVSMPKNIYYL